VITRQSFSSRNQTAWISLGNVGKFVCYLIIYSVLFFILAEKKIHKMIRKNIHECKIQNQDSAIQFLCQTAAVRQFALVYILLSPIFSQTLEAGYTDRFYVVLSVPPVNCRL
jgi:hypothetical protein